MQAPAAPLSTTGTHEASLNAVVPDDDLMEALGYFSVEEMATPAQVSSSDSNFKNSPLIDGASTSTDTSAMNEDVDSILLSLDIQELLPPEETEQGEPPPQNDRVSQQQEQQPSPKKVDRRLRPNSTAKRRNRRRPKHELDYLRSKVVELQEELAALGSADVDSSPAALEPNALALVNQVAFSSWKHIAERQKLEVDSAIAENCKLRTRLLGQLQVARVLEAAINQHQRETGSATIGCGLRPFTLNMTEQQIFAQLDVSLEAQLAEVSTVLTTKGLSNVLDRLQGGFEFKREADSLLFRHEEARLLPFSVQSLHHAIWNCLHNGAVMPRTNAQLLTEDHSNVIYCETLEFSKARRANMTKRVAFRRRFEEDRVVVVWSSYVEIDGSVFVRLREKGWSTCSTFEYHKITADAGSVVRGCMTRMAVELTPEVAEFPSGQQHIGEMTDLIVGTYRHNFGLIHEVVENVLRTSGATVKAETSSDGNGLAI